MVHSKKNLKTDIQQGTSLLEIINENIDVYVEIFHGLYFRNKKRTRNEIIKIVIDDLNDELQKI